MTLRFLIQHISLSFLSHSREGLDNMFSRVRKRLLSAVLQRGFQVGVRFARASADQHTPFPGSQASVLCHLQRGTCTQPPEGLLPPAQGASVLAMFYPRKRFPGEPPKLNDTLSMKVFGAFSFAALSNSCPWLAMAGKR